jgi:sec-independent protein translocase protein TatA
MGSFSIWHLALLAAVLLLVFGGKFKVSDMMGDVAKGIKSFKKGLADDPEEAKTLDTKVETVVNTAKEKAKS